MGFRFIRVEQEPAVSAKERANIEKQILNGELIPDRSTYLEEQEAYEISNQLAAGLFEGPETEKKMRARLAELNAEYNEAIEIAALEERDRPRRRRSPQR